MTIHKINPDRVDAEARPFSVGVSFQHELYDLAEAVFKTRAIQAFESVATRYPIHRLVRCAARRKLEEVFDDLALNMELAPQRLDTGSLLLDGPGAFIHAEGKRKVDYCSCTFNVWADSKLRADNIRATILRIVGDQRVREEMFVIDWNVFATLQPLADGVTGIIQTSSGFAGTINGNVDGKRVAFTIFPSDPSRYCLVKFLGTAEGGVLAGQFTSIMCEGSEAPR